MRSWIERYGRGRIGALGFVAVMLWAVPAFAQTAPTATPNDSLAWDYTDANLAAGAVDHFDVCLDTAPCVSVTVAASKITGQSSYTYKLPALTVGSHTAVIKACNTATCSAANPSFAFQLVIQPQPVTNIRIGGGA